MQIMKKIFFTDLDDTLLNRQKEISPGNKRAIEKLLSQGHAAVISTGRALSSAIHSAEALGLIGENCYIICFNGGQIYDTGKKELLYSNSVPLEYVKPIFQEARTFDIHIQTYSDTHVVCEKDTFDLQEYARLQNIPVQIVPDVTSALEHAPAKLLALDYRNPEKASKFRQHISRLYEGRLDVFMSNAFMVEMVPPHVNKGNAIHFLCHHLNIPIENSVAAGDAENDLTMIQAAHIGAAMCNGVDLLKEQADYVTKSDCDHDGVAEIIEKFILQ